MYPWYHDVMRTLHASPTLFSLIGPLLPSYYGASYARYAMLYPLEGKKKTSTPYLFTPSRTVTKPSGWRLDATRQP